MKADLFSLFTLLTIADGSLVSGGEIIAPHSHGCHTLAIGHAKDWGCVVVYEIVRGGTKR